MTGQQLAVPELARHFDHTLLKADATRAGFEKLGQEARDYGFAMVAINLGPVRLSKELLAGTDVHVGADLVPAGAEHHREQGRGDRHRHRRRR